MLSAPRAVSEPVRGYLDNLRTRFRTCDLVGAADALAGLRVLVVGDLIIDEYCYCTVSGTVSKYPVIAAIYDDLHRMVGGGAVIARHARQYARSVDYVCTVGDRDRHAEFAAALLVTEDVATRFFGWPDSFTVTKRRYITGGYPNPLTRAADQQHPPNIRLFEIGYVPPRQLPLAVEDVVCEHLERVAGSYDAVILADFGHGLVTPRVADVVGRRARWWAVNAQTNSSNYGFNRVTKFHGPDFVCIDELEARLPSGSRDRPIEDIVAELKAEMRCGTVMVTRGSAGLILFNGTVVGQAPALATTIVDTVGAGDAVLAMASLCRAAAVDEALTVFLGACMGAIAASIVGNEEPVRKEELLRLADSLLVGVPGETR